MALPRFHTHQVDHGLMERTSGPDPFQKYQLEYEHLPPAGKLTALPNKKKRPKGAQVCTIPLCFNYQEWGHNIASCP